MSLLKRIRAELRNRRYTDGWGAACNFYKIRKDETLGVKVYHQKKAAYLTYEEQVKAASVELAPPIRSRIFVVHWRDWDGDWHKGYAYTTKIADMTTNKGDYYEYRDDLQWLQNQLNSNGFATNDLHGGNWGYYNGKPVCIDFSHFYDVLKQWNREQYDAYDYSSNFSDGSYDDQLDF